MVTLSGIKEREMSFNRDIRQGHIRDMGFKCILQNGKCSKFRTLFFLFVRK